MKTVTRRTLLSMAATGAAAAAFPFRSLALQEAYGGFAMGIQTYSLRGFDLDGTIARVKELGLRYCQFYPGHQMSCPASPEQIQTYKAKLSESGLEIRSFGVVNLKKETDHNRPHFEFAKAMGFNVIVCDPDRDAFESIDALTKEYGMKIAIHNHGPGSRYDKLDQVLKAVEKYPEAIGACVDTGHYIRSGEDPVKVIRALGPRVHDVHLKDAMVPDTFKLLGQGSLDVVETLRALKEAKFDGLLALEYELNPKDPMDDLKACLATTREAVKKLG